jgi:hypothetical protein
MVSVMTRFLSVGALACAFLMSSVSASAAAPASIVGQVTCGADEETPAAHIMVVAQGLQLETVTDATGHFELTNLPTSQPITIQAVSDPEASVVVSRTAVALVAGETLDVGSMDLAVCGQPVTPQPDENVQDNEH